MEKITILINELRLLGFDVATRYFSDGKKCKVFFSKGGYSGGKVFNPSDGEIVNLFIERLEELIASEKLEIQKKQSDVFNDDNYSDFSKQLALSSSLKELECELKKLEKAMEKATQAHLSAIEKTSKSHGNQGNGQARAQRRNVVDRLSVSIMQYRHAIELHRLYPNVIFQNQTKTN